MLRFQIVRRSTESVNLPFSGRPVLRSPTAPMHTNVLRNQLIVGRKSNLFFDTILPLSSASAGVASLVSVVRHY